MTLYLPGIHEPDHEAADLFEGKPGTVVFAEAIGCNPNDKSGGDYRWWAERGFRVLVRLNNGWRPDGTIPAPSLYEAFAHRCANFVAASQGCGEWIIGNEPNHANEHPQGKVIKPAEYALCFAMCRKAIRQVQSNARLIIAAVAPWDQTSGDWLQYWRDTLQAIVALGAFDDETGIALHTYTQGADPYLIDSDEQRHGWFWHFGVFEQQIAAIPEAMRHLSLDITETDQIDPWANANSGWVKRAMQRVDAWNKQPGTQKIRSVVLYRWPRYDKVYSFADKGGVKDDFRQACRMGLLSPDVSGVVADSNPPEKTYLPDIGHDKGGEVPTITRNITADFRRRVPEINVSDEPGYKLITAEYVPNGAQRFGPDHHILVDVLDAQGKRQMGVPVHFYWADDGVEVPTNKVNEPYAADYGMTSAGHGFGVWVGNDRGASDSVFGMGLGTIEQPDWGHHVTYYLVFQQVTTRPSTEQPTAPARTLYVIVPDGANLRADPSAQSALVIAIPHGEAVEQRGFALATDGATWVAARYGIQTGWIRRDLLGETKPPALPTPTSPSSNVPALVHPIADPSKRVISQVFGVNAAKYAKFKINGHNGVDFAVVEGTPVRAVADGMVVVRGVDNEGFGNYVQILHAWGASLYAHLSRWIVTDGEKVRAGDVIGYSGNTGNSTGPHLHFGLRPHWADQANGYNGYIDPLPYLQQDDGPFLPQPKPQPAGKQQPAREQYMAWFRQYGAVYGIEWHLLAGLAYNESKYQAEPTSHKGALGMMQFMPKTWADMQVQLGVSDPFDPEQAIMAAAYYLVQIRRYLYQYKRHSDMWVVAAYNWGMGEVAATLAWADVPAETRRFADLVVECGEMLRRWEDGW